MNISIKILFHIFKIESRKLAQTYNFAFRLAIGIGLDMKTK